MPYYCSHVGCYLPLGKELIFYLSTIEWGETKEKGKIKSVAGSPAAGGTVWAQVRARQDATRAPIHGFQTAVDRPGWGSAGEKMCDKTRNATQRNTTRHIRNETHF